MEPRSADGEVIQSISLYRTLTSELTRNVACFEHRCRFPSQIEESAIDVSKLRRETVSLGPRSADREVKHCRNSCVETLKHDWRPQCCLFRAQVSVSIEDWNMRGRSRRISWQNSEDGAEISGLEDKTFIEAMLRDPDTRLDSAVSCASAAGVRSYHRLERARLIAAAPT